MQEKRSCTLKNKRKLFFAACKSIEFNEAFLALYENFMTYKKIGLEDYDDFPAPTIDIQRDEDSLVDIFGKDKRTEFPKPESKNQNAHHIHIFDNQESFKKWKKKPQLLRSSDSILFYSAFKHEEVYYFYVLKIIKARKNPPQSGHAPFEEKDEKTLKEMLKSAKSFKEKITKKK